MVKIKTFENTGTGIARSQQLDALKLVHLLVLFAIISVVYRTFQYSTFNHRSVHFFSSFFPNLFRQRNSVIWIHREKVLTFNESVKRHFSTINDYIAAKQECAEFVLYRILYEAIYVSKKIIPKVDRSEYAFLWKF